jgi:hypothetical protein
MIINNEEDFTPISLPQTLENGTNTIDPVHPQGSTFINALPEEIEYISYGTGSKEGPKIEEEEYISPLNTSELQKYEAPVENIVFPELTSSDVQINSEEEFIPLETPIYT